MGSFVREWCSSLPSGVSASPSRICAHPITFGDIRLSGRVLVLDGKDSVTEVVENIFEFEGRPGHEIVHVFGVDSADIDAFPLDVQLRVLDEGSPVHWVLSGGSDRPIYPAEAARIINALVQ